MKLKEVNFNEIKDNGFIGLSIQCGRNIIASGFIGETLKKSIPLAEKEVISQRAYFNEWVIEIE